MKLLRVRPAYILIFIVFLSFFLLPNAIVYAENQTYERILTDATDEIKVNDTNFNFRKQTESIINGEYTHDTSGIFSQIINLFFSALKENFHLLTKISALCIFSGILSAISGDEASQVGFLACLVLITSLSVDVLKNILILAETTIDNLLIFMQSLIPTISMLTSGAQSTFAITFHPSLFVAIQVITYACKEWFLPMILFVSVLSVINSMTAKFHITKLLETCRLFIKWGIGLLMTIYVALLGISGFGGAVQASTMSKTVKYAIVNFIPMVGSVLAESAESVLSSMYLIKNAVGITGILAVLAITLMPILNILATSVIFRLAASICEPTADRRITKLISDFAGNVSLVFSILLAVCAMFIISIAMLLSLTNMGVNL